MELRDISSLEESLCRMRKTSSDSIHTQYSCTISSAQCNFPKIHHLEFIYIDCVRASTLSLWLTTALWNAQTREPSF